MAQKIMDSAFYNFVFGVIAVLGLIALSVLGIEDKNGLTNFLFSVAGAGVWGGMQAQNHVTGRSKNSYQKPAEKSTD